MPASARPKLARPNTAAYAINILRIIGLLHHRSWERPGTGIGRASCCGGLQNSKDYFNRNKNYYSNSQCKSDHEGPWRIPSYDGGPGFDLPSGEKTSINHSLTRLTVPVGLARS